MRTQHWKSISTENRRFQGTEPWSAETKSYHTNWYLIPLSKLSSELQVVIIFIVHYSKLRNKETVCNSKMRNSLSPRVLRGNWRQHSIFLCAVIVIRAFPYMCTASHMSTFYVYVYVFWSKSSILYSCVHAMKWRGNILHPCVQAVK